MMGPSQPPVAPRTTDHCPAPLQTLRGTVFSVTVSWAVTRSGSGRGAGGLSPTAPTLSPSAFPRSMASSTAVSGRLEPGPHHSLLGYSATMWLALVSSRLQWAGKLSVLSTSCPTFEPKEEGPGEIVFQSSAGVLRPFLCLLWNPSHSR